MVMNSIWVHDDMMAIIAPVDRAFRDHEQVWGVGRIENLVSTDTLARWRTGWARWKQAITDSDVTALRDLAGKMRAALAYMEREAIAAGHAPIQAETWEALMPDGRVLVVVRTSAEAHRVARAARLGADADIPPDLLATVRHQQAGREIVVWTMDELARVLPNAELIQAVKVAFPGARVQPRATTAAHDAADWARADDVRLAIEGVID